MHYNRTILKGGDQNRKSKRSRANNGCCSYTTVVSIEGVKIIHHYISSRTVCPNDILCLPLIAVDYVGSDDAIVVLGGWGLPV